MRFQRKKNSFPSAHLSDSEDGDLPSVKEIIARAWRAPKKKTLLSISLAMMLIMTSW
jgi:hypothetical protein